jgi:hypothetical protein
LVGEGIDAEKLKPGSRGRGRGPGLRVGRSRRDAGAQPAQRRQSPGRRARRRGRQDGPDARGRARYGKKEASRADARTEWKMTYQFFLVSSLFLVVEINFSLHVSVPFRI